MATGNDLYKIGLLSLNASSNVKLICTNRAVFNVLTPGPHFTNMVQL